VIKKILNISKYVVPAFVLGSALSGTVVWAATRYVQAEMGTSTVTTNGQVFANPPKLVYDGTTFVQLYAIQHSLINAGIGALWTGNSFNMSVPSWVSSGLPHLNAVIFESNASEPYSTTNGTGAIQGIVYSLPVGTDNFYTYVDLENVSAGSHTFDVKFGKQNGSNSVEGGGTFSQKSTGSYYVDIHWNAPIAPGYNVANVYLDGTYLGSAAIWGTN
jgi:hypothetical protein